MSTRTSIQSKIIDFIESGIFNKITYVKNKPTDTGIPTRPTAVGNEVGGVVNDGAKSSSRTNEFTLKSWRFTFLVKFPCEADVTDFVTKQLSNLRIQEQGLAVSLTEVTYEVEHPVTGGPQTGTQMVLNITASTRR